MVENNNRRLIFERMNCAIVPIQSDAIAYIRQHLIAVRRNIRSQEGVFDTNTNARK